VTPTAADAAAAQHSEVTSVIRHTVRPGKQADYEAWLRKIVPLASSHPGHRGVNVISPTGASTQYTVVLHFDHIDNLRSWLDSDTRRRLIGEALPLLAGEDQVEIKTGLEFWFTPPGKVPRARPYKQYLVTLSVIYPLTLLIPVLLAPLVRQIPFLEPFFVRQLVSDAVIVGLIIYAIMPRYTRLLAAWLYR
jgi:hypothetical protein